MTSPDCLALPALERGVTYTLLARSLAYPDADNVFAMRQTARDAMPWVELAALDALCRLAFQVPREEIEAAHADLFSFSTSPDAPNFETAYFSADPAQQTATMADIAGFYRAFGVDTGPGALRPDDICVELAFMAYLCQKQQHAEEHLGAPRVTQTVRAQRLFMRDHLGRWAPALGSRIAVRAAHQFYRTAGDALAEWVERDAGALDARPVEFADAPNPEWATTTADYEAPTVAIDQSQPA